MSSATQTTSLVETGYAPAAPQTVAPIRAVPAPSLPEVLLICAATAVIFIGLVSATRGFFPLVDNFGDNPAYLSAAYGIRHWDFRDVDTKHFWGLPYAIAATSTVLHVSERTALLMACWASYLTTIILAYRLWGGWIAAYFTILNFAWLQFSLLGGAESLFMSLLLGSFWCARNQRWLTATILASLATTVRPLGFFALLGIGVSLLALGRFRTAVRATATGVSIGSLYVLPFFFHFGNAFINVERYQQADWQGSGLLSWPFQAIISGIKPTVPWTNLTLSFLWMAFVLVGGGAAWTFRKYGDWWRNTPVELIFAIAYFVFLFTYNSPEWARTTFIRFAIPIVPFVLLALESYIPKDRRMLYGFAFVAAVLAAASALGIRSLYAFF